MLLVTRTGGENVGLAKIKRDHLAAEEKMHRGSDAKKRSKWKSKTPARTGYKHDPQTDDRAGQRGEKNRKRNGRPAQKGADHGQQLDVTATHSLNPCQALINPGNRKEEATAC